MVPYGNLCALPSDKVWLQYTPLRMPSDLKVLKGSICQLPPLEQLKGTSGTVTLSALMSLQHLVKEKNWNYLRFLNICEPLLAQPVDLCSRMYSHLAPLNLADTHQGDTPVEVDMLIGSDFYWQLTIKEIIQGQVGPVAINTKPGWVLSAPVNSSEVD